MDSHALSLKRVNMRSICSHTESISKNTTMKEIYAILKALYLQYLQLASLNKLSADFFSNFKAILLSIALIQKSILNKNKSITQFIFSLLTIYIKHNKDDSVPMRNFIDEYTKDILPIPLISEIFKREKIQSSEFLTSTFNKNSFQSKLMRYLPGDFIESPIMPHAIEVDYMHKDLLLDLERYQVEYKAQQSKKQCTVIGDSLISPLNGVYYFEVTLLSAQSHLSIGLVSKVDYTAAPGSLVNSIGYYSETGDVYRDNQLIQSYPLEVSMNDHLGCCINFIDEQCFFTLNGAQLEAFSLDVSIEYFTAVCLIDLSQKIQINFGQSGFCFDLNSFKQSLMTKYYCKILDTVLKEDSFTYESLIADYLSFNGYEDTLTVFIPHTKQSSYELITQANFRKKIRGYLATKDFDSLKTLIRGKKALLIVHFYEKVWLGYDKYMAYNECTIGSFLGYLKKEIISQSDYEGVKQIMPGFEKVINEIFQSITEPFNITKSTIGDIMHKHLKDEEVFDYLNRYLSAELTSDYKESQFETILKQLIQIISVGLNHNQLLYKFLLSNDNDFNCLKKSLQSKISVSSNLSLSNNLSDYFDKMILEDSSIHNN